jgi:putative iron-regulated protein
MQQIEQKPLSEKGLQNPNPVLQPLAFVALVLIFASTAIHAKASGSEVTGAVEPPALKRAVVANYAAIMAATYEDSVAAATKLKSAVDDFLANPSEAGLVNARKAWVAARVPYSQSEAARFCDGPIDQLEGKINSWPIDEQYIDYVADSPDAGIINATSSYPVISRELILSLNEKEGKKNISTGFHAIEFLLWGQDRSTNAPGDRSWRDYTNAARNSERRRQFLRIVTELLVEHLKSVEAEWADGKADNYRSRFVAIDPDAALANILKGIGALSGPEVAGERLTTPYETKAQEEEQDCFSDNTCNDLIDDARGLANVYFGRYKTDPGRKIQGAGLHDLLMRINPEFAAKLSTEVEAAVARAKEIPPPFDQAILGPNSASGRIAIKKAIKTFQAQSDLVAEAATVLSIKLNL